MHFQFVICMLQLSATGHRTAYVGPAWPRVWKKIQRAPIIWHAPLWTSAKVLPYVVFVDN